MSKDEPALNKGMLAYSYNNNNRGSDVFFKKLHVCPFSHRHFARSVINNLCGIIYVRVCVCVSE